jgi:hypothetical protein
MEKTTGEHFVPITPKTADDDEDEGDWEVVPDI